MGISTWIDRELYTLSSSSLLHDDHTSASSRIGVYIIFGINIFVFVERMRRKTIQNPPYSTAVRIKSLPNLVEVGRTSTC